MVTYNQIKPRYQVSTNLIDVQRLADNPSLLASRPLSGHRAVVATSASTVDYADKDTPSHESIVIGIITEAANTGDAVMVQIHKTIAESSWDWEVGKPIFLGNSGMLTQTIPTTGFSLVLGAAISPDVMYISLGQVIELV